MGDGKEATETPRFTDPGNAPEFFACGLHSVEVMGTVCRFVLYVDRRTVEGEIIREPPFTCIMPLDNVGPSIALVLRTLGARIVIPIVGCAAKELLLH